jgi:hypothetical protein
VIEQTAFGPVVQVSNTRCRELLSTNRDLTLDDYRGAIEEQYFKWITAFAESTVVATHHVSQMLVNFGLEFNPDTLSLTFSTTRHAIAASEEQVLSSRFAFRPRGQGANGRGAGTNGRGAGTNGRGRGAGTNGRGRGAAGHGRGDNDDMAVVAVSGHAALAEAYKSEQVVAHHLLAFVSTDHLQYNKWIEFRKTESCKVQEIVGSIDLAHRALQCWYGLQRQARDSVEGSYDCESSETRDFPGFYEGCQGRLRYHYEHMTPYRQTLHFVLGKCREMKLRRHGARFAIQLCFATFCTTQFNLLYYAVQPFVLRNSTFCTTYYAMYPCFATFLAYSFYIACLLLIASLLLAHCLLLIAYCLLLVHAGQKLYVQKKIPRYTLVFDPQTGEHVCESCGLVESAHEKYDVPRRPADHVYRPMCHVDHTQSIGTYSWEPLEPHTEIRSFVRAVCNKRDNYSVWAKAVDFFEKLIHEVENTVNDSDLPILDMACKQFGIVNSFRCVFSFFFICLLFACTSLIC